MARLRRLATPLLLIAFVLASPTVAGAAPVVEHLPQTAPCLAAAMAALTANGALYSQGGHHPNDPIDPDTGQPYPRTGPSSYDCSGLVWWAYMRAGITIGMTTYQQLDDGVAIPCSLADLKGTQTTCWAPGDLIFLTYTGGQHVAIYVGKGLFMDCYSHDTGCMVHNVAQNSFYQKHFRPNAGLARRIVSGCESLTLDPGTPTPPTLLEPTFETLPDVASYVSFTVPQCNSCAGDDPIFTPGEPPEGTWYDLTYGFRWLAWAMEDLVRRILCWLLGMVQLLANIAASIANVFIQAVNQIWKFLLFSWLTLRTWLYTGWDLAELMRGFFQAALVFFALFGAWLRHR